MNELGSFFDDNFFSQRFRGEQFWNFYKCVENNDFFLFYFIISVINNLIPSYVKQLVSFYDAILEF